VTVKPVTPVPAATVLLLREASPGVEVLLMQRHRASKFAGGDFVYPGGKIEVDDNPDDAAQWCQGFDIAKAAARLQVPDEKTAIGCYVGAIRETFEEVGVLLAYDANGTWAQVNDARFAEYRTACQTDNQAFWDMVRKEKLRLATDTLVYFAHWVTPEEQPFRYDTRFFAAPMPAGQAPVGDEHEVIDLRWYAPKAALAAFKAGEISLRNPTVQNMKLVDAGSVAAALEGVKDREVPTIRPRVIMEGDKRKILMPGDPGYF
jgi:8-oxo-dGTP pyrophosphatase MutT (NUDIX family)